MTGIVSAALQAGAEIYGTTAETVWFVTFTTNDTRRGKLTPLETGFYSLNDEQTLYIFHDEHVVHLSPQISPKQVHQSERSFSASNNLSGK